MAAVVIDMVAYEDGKDAGQEWRSALDFVDVPPLNVAGAAAESYVIARFDENPRQWDGCSAAARSAHYSFFKGHAAGSR